MHPLSAVMRGKSKPWRRSLRETVHIPDTRHPNALLAPEPTGTHPDSSPSRAFTWSRSPYFRVRTRAKQTVWYHSSGRAPCKACEVSALGISPSCQPWMAECLCDLCDLTGGIMAQLQRRLIPGTTSPFSPLALQSITWPHLADATSQCGRNTLHERLVRE